MDKYDPKKTEIKWQEYWEKYPELFKADEKSDAEKKYILDMFPVMLKAIRPQTLFPVI
jgi:leucyl-tRNA synthetase